MIRVESADRIRTITFDRREKKNALTAAMRRDLARHLGEADADSGIDVVIITGADPAFCGGVDLKDAAATPPAERPPNPGVVLRAMAKPVLCAVNGVCVTGGLEIALNCTLIVASERAAFGDRHARFGLIPGWGLSALLPEAIGVRRAREMSLTGRLVDAAEALRWGLVNHVVPHAELLSFTRNLAADVIATDARAGRALLALYARADGKSLDVRLALERETVDATRKA